jgi:hypothetical protein
MNLGPYEIRLVESGEEVVVVSYVEPSPRSQSPDGMAGPDCAGDGVGYETHPYYDTN